MVQNLARYLPVQHYSVANQAMTFDVNERGNSVQKNFGRSFIDLHASDSFKVHEILVLIMDNTVF